MENEKEKKPISDERLDQLLMQVEIPEGLHADLIGLADEESADQTVSPASLELPNRWYSISSIVVAACYLILTAGIVIFWPQDGPVTARQENRDKEQNRKPELESRAGQRIQSDTNSDQRADFESRWQRSSIARTATLDSIERKLNQLKIQELEEKLARLEASHRMLESNESLSLVLAIADQTPLNLGGSKELIDEDMKFILENFPKSQGAEIAAQVADSGN